METKEIENLEKEIKKSKKKLIKIYYPLLAQHDTLKYKRNSIDFITSAGKRKCPFWLRRMYVQCAHTKLHAFISISVSERKITTIAEKTKKKIQNV